MKIEANYASLEMAEKMQKAGIDFGKTAFVWVNVGNGNKIVVVRHWAIFQEEAQDKRGNKVFPEYKIIENAPSIAEMIDRLPKRIDRLPKRIDAKENCIHIVPHLHIYYDCADNFVCGYVGIDNDLWKVTVNSKIPAEALSKLLLWANEKGYL